MENKKTDSSVKAGLHPEGNTNTVNTNPVSGEDEKLYDEDDLVHDPATATEENREMIDPDEAAHQLPEKDNINDDEEQDIDDLLHRPQNDMEAEH